MAKKGKSKSFQAEVEDDDDDDWIEEAEEPKKAAAKSEPVAEPELFMDMPKNKPGEAPPRPDDQKPPELSKKED